MAEPQTLLYEARQHGVMLTGLDPADTDATGNASTSNFFQSSLAGQRQ